MIYENRLEIKTKGIVCGPSIFVTKAPSAVTILGGKKRPFLSCPVIIKPQKQLVVYKVVVRSREGREEIWCRSFLNKSEAIACYASLLGIDIHNNEGIWLPPRYLDGELEYYFATVVTFNTTTNNSGLDWTAGGTKCPGGVTATDYLVVAGGGAGGGYIGGGGGAGGLLTSTGMSVTAGTNYPVVIGAGGTPGAAGGDNANPGAVSSFNSIAPLGGGQGTGQAVTTQHPSSTGVNGSGGGNRAGGTGGLGTSSQGNNGGNGAATGALSGGGGGGASAVGSNGTSTNGGNGGNGTASSISGSSVTYAGGGGGGTDGTGSAGSGGTGGGGNGTTSSPGTSGTANLGGGGGGASVPGTGLGGSGGSGVTILSFTVANNLYFSNLAIAGL